jgi:hypothetical protein
MELNAEQLTAIQDSCAFAELLLYFVLLGFLGSPLKIAK